MSYRGTTFFQQQELTSVRRVREAAKREVREGRRLRESNEAEEELTKQHKKAGMLKIAQKHHGEGRPDVAKKIRKKAHKKFSG